MAALAARTGLTITVTRLPPGTSKWNKVEHRLFSFISMNWRGRPLTSHEVVLQTIAATTTATGLTVHADLDTTAYPTGIKIPNQHMKPSPTRRPTLPRLPRGVELHPQPAQARHPRSGLSYFSVTTSGCRRSQPIGSEPWLGSRRC